MCRTILQCVLVSLCVLSVTGVPRRLFYPYGTARGDESLDEYDDVSSPEVQLVAPIHFYDGFYTSIYVGLYWRNCAMNHLYSFR